MKKLKDFLNHEVIGYSTGVNPEIESNYTYPITASDLRKIGVPENTLTLDFKEIIKQYF